MISVTFDEDKGTPRAIIAVVVIFLLFAAIPVFLMAPKYMAEIPKSVERSTSSGEQVTWDKPQPGEHCAAFGTREYTARLWNLPLFADWTRICENTKAKIHGVNIKPSYCESKWPFGGVEGHWVIDFNEEDCTPHWGKFVDKGCLAKGSKTRRFQSRLWNIKRRQDWRTMCETAPANFQSLKNATPKLCDDRGIWGIYGIWEVDDPNC